MKKVIDGKLYDTETATEIASFDNGRGWDDFHHLNETLYITKKGQHFLYGIGGAMSKYSEKSGNMTHGTENIELLNAIEAREWAESNNIDADIIAKHFDVEIG